MSMCLDEAAVAVRVSGELSRIKEQRLIAALGEHLVPPRACLLGTTGPSPTIQVSWWWSSLRAAQVSHSPSPVSVRLRPGASSS
jgi:hypothetical protein